MEFFFGIALVIQGDSILLGTNRRKMGKRIFKISNIRKTLHYLKKNGIRHAYYAAKERIEEEKKADYVYLAPKPERLAMQKAETNHFPYRFSIVVPAYETKESFLKKMISSVVEQSYENWELILADASAGDSVRKVVEQYLIAETKKEAKREGIADCQGRIRYIHLPENRGISENTNAGIKEATGDYIGFLDHDDFLAPDALYEIAKALETAEKIGRNPILLYSDEDKFENNTCDYIQPNIKYNFNLDLILSNNYICHLMLVKADVVKQFLLRKEYDGAQDYDLVLRIIGTILENTGAVNLGEKMVHVPKVLYHWRCHEASTAENTASKNYAYEAGKAAVEDFCFRQGWQTKVSHSLHLGFYRIAYEPDLFTVRREVGILGGRILDRHNKITSGIYGTDGEKLYQGIHKEYSGGSTHRAALLQDCAAVDIRCMRVRKELQPLFEQIVGIPYQEHGKQKLADVSGIFCDEEGYRKLSLELGRAVWEKGYLVVWNPELTIKMRFKM